MDAAAAAAAAARALPGVSLLVTSPPPAGPLAAAALCVLLAFTLKFLWGVRKFERMALPSPPIGSFLTGHVDVMLTDTSPLRLAEWVRQCGPLMKLRLLGETLVILTDPAAIAKLNRAPGVTKPDMYRAFDLPSQKQPSVFSDPGSAYWKAVRSAVAPCFSMTSLKRTFPWLLRLCQLAADEVGREAASGPVDVADLAARVTSDTIGDMLLSKDLGGMSRRAANVTGDAAVPGDAGPDYIALVREYLWALHFRLNDPFWRFKFGAKSRRAAAAYAAWDGAMEGIARGVVKSAPPEYTIAGHLLKAVDPATGKPLTLTQLKSEMSIFYIAGFETTSHAISWTLGLLAAHPAAQESLAAELAAAGLAPGPGRPAPREFEWGDLGRLPLLLAVIKESLRLFAPAAGGSLRAIAEDTEVLGHVLPKGTWVAQPLYALGRAPFNYGPDADEFKPERWLGHSSQAPSPTPSPPTPSNGGGGGGDAGAARSGGGGGPPDAMPFSVGPRDCVGRALATLELQAVLATLVGRFKFSLPPGSAGAPPASGVAPLQARACYHITLFQRGGMPLVAEPRAA